MESSLPSSTGNTSDHKGSEEKKDEDTPTSPFPSEDAEETLRVEEPKAAATCDERDEEDPSGGAAAAAGTCKELCGGGAATAAVRLTDSGQHGAPRGGGRAASSFLAAPSAVVSRIHAASVSFLPSSFSSASPPSSSSSSSLPSSHSAMYPGQARTKDAARMIGTTRLHTILERGVEDGSSGFKDDHTVGSAASKAWMQQLQQQKRQQAARKSNDDLPSPTRTRNQSLEGTSTTSSSSSSSLRGDSFNSRASKRLSLALLGHTAGDIVLKAQDDFNLGYQPSPREARRKSTVRGRAPVLSTVYKAIITGDERVNVRKNTADSLPLLVGEELMLKVHNVSLLSKMDPSWPTVRVTLYATNYQLILKKKDVEICLPIMNIRSFKKRSILQLDQDQIKLYLNDMRTFKLTFDNRSSGMQQPQQQSLRRTQIASAPREKDSDLVYSYIRSYHPMESLSQLFAFRYRITIPASLASSVIDGWSLYSPENDFERMGLPNERWRLTKINSTFQLCETYPKILCVPAAMNKHEIVAASQFRSRNRLPVLVFLHPKTGAPLVRCSQPLVGINGRRGPEDEKMVNLIRLSGQAAVLYIIDARPKANARANRTLGGGYEAMQAYEQCQLSFMNIENIHRMRESLYALFNLLKRGEAADRKGWLTALDESQWLKHIRAILAAACRVAHLLDEGHPVLTHCSDGWDRTPQLTALAQLILDPYYRTIHGFAVLVQKEFVSFGHKFSERNGHQTVDEGARTNSSDRSPVFLQFLDCVHQICRQFPCSFEFNEHFLTFLADESYNCRFGTFLLNTEKEREAKKIPETTVSIWTHVFLHREKFLNMFYKENRAAIYPSFSPRNIHLWEAYFLRWDSECVCKESTEMVMRYALRKIEKLNRKLQAYAQAEAVSEKKDEADDDQNQGSEDESHELNVIIGAKRARNSNILIDGPSPAPAISSPSSREGSAVGDRDKPVFGSPPTITVEQSQDGVDESADESSDESSEEDEEEELTPEEPKGKSETAARSERAEAGLTVGWGVGVVTSKRPRRPRARTAESGEAPEIQADGDLKRADMKQKGALRSQKRTMASLKQEKLSFVSTGQLTTATSDNRRSIFPSQPLYTPRRSQHRSIMHRGSKSDGEEDSLHDDLDSSREDTDPNLSLYLLSGDSMHSKGIKHNSTSLEERDVPPTWIPDSWARVCFHCTRPFTAINRKHHCRYCGNIFCARCSSRKIAIPKFSYHKAVRVCDPCHSRLIRSEEQKRELSQQSWAGADESLFRLGLVSSASEGQQKAVKRKFTQRSKLGNRIRGANNNGNNKNKKKHAHAASSSSSIGGT